MPIWDRIKKLFRDNGQKLVARSLHPSQVDVQYNTSVLSAEQGYVSVTIVDMFLEQSRNWFKDRLPVVHGLVRLKFADKVHEIAAIVGPSQSQIGSKTTRATALNYTLLPQTPYRGGEVEMEAALIAMPGNDLIARTIDVLSGFSSLVGPPLGAALAIAGKVKDAAEKLFDDGAIELCWHNMYEETEGGSNQLRAQYIVMINAPLAAVVIADLRVIEDRLSIMSGGVAVPFTGRDYMLIRIGISRERTDFASFSDIESAWSQARDVYLANEVAKGDALRGAALSLVTKHPELTFVDRRRAAQAIVADLKLYATPVSGISEDGTRPRTFAALVAAQAADTANLAEPSLEEFLG